MLFILRPFSHFVGVIWSSIALIFYLELKLIFLDIQSILSLIKLLFDQLKYLLKLLFLFLFLGYLRFKNLFFIFFAMFLTTPFLFTTTETGLQSAHHILYKLIRRKLSIFVELTVTMTTVMTITMAVTSGASVDSAIICTTCCEFGASSIGCT